jgi:hypothetical protein
MTVKINPIYLFCSIFLGIIGVIFSWIFWPWSSDRPPWINCLIAQNGPSIRLIRPLINQAFIRNHRKWPTVWSRPMIDTGNRKPFVHVAVHVFPGDIAFLAASRETTWPYACHLLTESLALLAQ